MTEYKIKLQDNELIANYSGWLHQSAKVVQAINEQNGWFESDRTFGDDIALLHSEVSEALEAFRSWGIADVTPGNPIYADTGLHKPEGVGSELADVLVRLLDTCSRYDIDLEHEFLRKLQFNAVRGHRHGNKQL